MRKPRPENVFASIITAGIFVAAILGIETNTEEK